MPAVMYVLPADAYMVLADKTVTFTRFNKIIIQYYKVWQVDKETIALVIVQHAFIDQFLIIIFSCQQKPT